MKGRKSSGRRLSKGSSLKGSRRSSRSRSRSRSSMPGWLPYAIGGVCLSGLVYGLMQIDSVNDFVQPVIDDVSDFFGLSDVEGIDTSNITHDRTYSNSGSMVR